MNTETMRLVPIMLIDDKSRYITHENNRQDMLAACNEVGECLKNVMTDCYANNSLTKEAYISNIQKYFSAAKHELTFEPDMEVTLVDQYGRLWSETGANTSMTSPLTGDRTMYGYQQLFEPLGIGSTPFNEEDNPVPLDVIVDYCRQEINGVKEPSIDILSLGKGPLSNEGARSYIENSPMYMLLSKKWHYPELVLGKPWLHPTPLIEEHPSQSSANGEEDTTAETKLDYKVYVTAEQMEEFGWPLSDEELRHLNLLLKKNGITNKKSIRMFLATCAHESNYGKNKLEIGTDEYFESRGYDRYTRGAGYIQVTKKEQEAFYADINKKPPKDRAQDIADNYAWEAAVWEWAVQEKGSGRIMNEYVQEHGGGENVFLATQYFINGYLDKKYYPLFNDDLQSIREGRDYECYFKEEWTDIDGKKYIGVLKVNGRKYRLPVNYEDRLKKYRDAINIFK